MWEHLDSPKMCCKTAVNSHTAIYFPLHFRLHPRNASCSALAVNNVILNYPTLIYCYCLVCTAHDLLEDFYSKVISQAHWGANPSGATSRAKPRLFRTRDLEGGCRTYCIKLLLFFCFFLTVKLLFVNASFSSLALTCYLLFYIKIFLWDTTKWCL